MTKKAVHDPTESAGEIVTSRLGEDLSKGFPGGTRGIVTYRPAAALVKDSGSGLAKPAGVIVTAAPSEGPSAPASGGPLDYRVAGALVGASIGSSVFGALGAAVGGWVGFGMTSWFDPNAAARGTRADGSPPRKVFEGKADYLPARSKEPLVEAAVAAVIERVPEIVHARQEALSQETIDLLVDAYLKSAPTAPARHQIEMDNARERARFVEEFPCYTSREVAELAGHEAANASATATRWKKARRIVGLPWKGSDLYPAFQFREGRPRPIVGRLIETLPERLSPWQIVFWLTSSNSWLGGATPLDRLDDEAALIAAATRESEALGG